MSEIRRMTAAEWIWCRGDARPNQYAHFLQDFSVNKQNAVLYIAADMNYAVFVNGRYVPGFAYSDYPECRSVDTLDLSAYLQAGSNRLCVVGYCQGVTSSTYEAGNAAVRFAVYSREDCVAVSNGKTLSRQAPDYISGPVECITAQLSYSFRYDARRYDGWLEPSYIPGGDWQPAVTGVSSAALTKRPIRPLQLGAPCAALLQTYGHFTDTDGADELPCGKRMQLAALSFCGRLTAGGRPLRLPSENGVEVTATEGDGVYVLLDLKQETVGLLTLDLELPQEAKILIGFGEHLDDLRVRTEVGGRQFGAVYHARAGRQTFTHYHKRLGCRYLQLHIYAPSVRLYYAGLAPVDYPVTEVPSPAGNDRLMNAIYRTGIRTLRMCMHEHYEDCPWREQALYAMDGRIEMLCGYYAFREFTMPRATIALLAQGLRPDGLLEMCAPSRRPRTIPGFSLAFVDCLHDYAVHSGDLAFAESLLPVVETILQTLGNWRNAQGLLCQADNENYWHFYEWSAGLDGSVPARSASGVYAPLQAMFIIAAENYLSLCRLTGHTPAWEDLLQQIDRLRQACQQLWHGERQVFVTCPDAEWPDNELVQALMLCAGVPTEEQKALLLEKLANAGHSQLNPVTLSHSIYKYEALMTQPQTYGRFVADDIERIWGRMLFRGATTFWETEKGAWDFFSAGSLCHGWSAIPVYLLHRYGEYLIGC